MLVEKNSDQQQLEEFIKLNALDGGFLQSSGWAKFQENFGRQVFRLTVKEDEEILGEIMLIKHQVLKFFNYFYAPRGPVLSKNLSTERLNEVFKILLKEIKLLARKEKVFLLRLDPAWKNSDLLVSNNFKFIGSVQPKSTLILDLSLSEEELLKQMKPKTRYNIKVAQKHGVEISLVENSDQMFEEFYQLLIKTAKRDEISIHSKDYYHKMLKIPACQLAVARYQGKVIAGNLMVFFGDWAIYLHGASDYQFRDKMAPYLLQWEMISYAKKNNFKFYDFWGADEQKWPGVTRFKSGFAPKRIFTLYVGAYDYYYSKLLYQVYGIIKKIMN